MKNKVIAAAVSICTLFSLSACGTTTTNDDSTTTAANNGGDAAVTTAADNGDADNGDASAETVTLTLWGAEEDQALLADLVEGFKAQYPDQTFDIKIGVESESTAKDTVLTDITAAADVFAFANDQLNDLVAAGALLDLNGEVSQVLPAYTGSTLDEILAKNSEGSVAACQKDGSTYAFPMGGGNNYFLYYDSTKVSEEQAQTWEGLLKAANDSGTKVGMTYASGWYNASFFLGAGFIADMNEDGTTVIDWNGTSADGYTGIDVVKGMSAIATDSGFMAIADGDISNQIASGALCAVVSGTWDAGAAQEAFGDGYAATKLPTYTCAGDQVQMSCFSGFKLMGVNAYSKNTGWAVLLAEYLTNEASQTARFEARQLAPTNLNTAEADAVKSNIAIAASAAQDVYGSVQNVGGKYWDPTATFGQMIANGELASADDAAIQSALDTMVEGVCAPVE